MRWKPEPKLILQKYPNQPIALYRGFAELIAGNTILEGKGYVNLSWYPAPSVTIEFVYFGEERIDFFKAGLELKLTELWPQERLKVKMEAGTYWGTGKNKLSGYLTEPFIKGESKDFHAITFHVTNFWWFNISNQYDWEDDDDENEIFIENEGWLTFEGQFIFDYENWHIVLATSNEHGELIERLETEGGYGVTHICKIEKLDKTSFNLNEVYDVLQAFSYYLSFARGFWVAPILVSGFNANGDLVMEEWKNPILLADAWQPSFSWTYNHIDNTELVEAFPGFMKRWQDALWKEVLKNCIQWFIEGSRYNSFVNTSIVLFQASLEKLAWTYLKTNDCLSSQGFKQLKVADQLRLLINFLQISPIALDEYPNLKKKSKELQWIDSFDGIVEVRNYIIHPQVKDKTTIITTEVLEETASIAREYLLIILLKISGYPYQLD
jgi:hypothetical protein